MGRTQEDYENALAIFRNCLINHYEHLVLGVNAIKQSQRIGNDPPTDMDAVQDSFRNATLLPRAIERTKVWRVSARYPILGVKPGWRPDLLQQIEWAAETVFGSDYTKYRHP